MDFNDKKLKRTTKIIYFLISSVLAIFLVLLSDVIIGDLDNTITYPYRSDYVDKVQEDRYKAIEEKLGQQIDELAVRKSNIRKMLEVANENKQVEQESFDNWIKTRNTLGSPSQDKEVLIRVKKLDEYAKIASEWKTSSDSLQSEIDELYNAKDANLKELSVIDEKTDKEYRLAINSYDLRVFLIRLLFAAPILVLGIYFFIRKRHSKLSPLYMGFSLFSLYVFFFGLVPYLPSYGGYIRYIVGILLTVGLGYYAIKKIRTYRERKKDELAESTTERAKKLENEVVEKAFNSHICPSCGKDFLLKPWEHPIKINVDGMQLISHYCRYCGLEIVSKCSNCGQANYAHLPYCITCGGSLKNS